MSCVFSYHPVLIFLNSSIRLLAWLWVYCLLSKSLNIHRKLIFTVIPETKEKKNFYIYHMSYLIFFCYKQVTDIWYDHLLRIVKIRTHTPDTPKGIGPVAEETPEDEEGLGESSSSSRVLACQFSLFIHLWSFGWIVYLCPTFPNFWCDLSFILHMSAKITTYISLILIPCVYNLSALKIICLLFLTQNVI